MDFRITRIDIGKLRRRLHRVRLGTFAAIELGDCRAVARLTCEAARLRNAISLAPAIRLGPA
jgi:hypothetical protein